MNNANLIREQFPAPQNFLSAIAVNKKIFPTQVEVENYLGFTEPTIDNSPCHFIPLDVKRLWFHDYCQQKGVIGKVIPSVDIKFDLQTAKGATGFVVATCEVWIGEALASRGIVAQSFSLDDKTEMDTVVANTVGMSQSKALTYAGFGAWNTAVMEDAATMEKFRQLASGNPQKTPDECPTDGSDLPFSISDKNGAAQQASGNANDQQGILGYEPATPIMQAKAMAWPLKFPASCIGKTLGEVLATNPNEIIKLANCYKADQRFKELAKTLLPDACKAAGKPIPNNL